ncbi:hypothetical protein EGW08_009802 [Elysia chlorotica]|uniref:Fibrinogen C-terminal domain-containing protein n=1 Tax=Elysia chlorotica TaxID=188477 RepID=A0A3S1A4C5_ELYCH|nr:hypothetical protein EGW08_009802 [Elysia chlorotica]
METLETTQPPFQCEHNGIYNSFNDSCDCRLTGGYVGVRCERLATSCMELYNYPYASGAHPLNMDVFGDGSLFFQTTCHLKFWYATQASFDFMKSTGSFDAALSYNDYVSGFRFGPDDYWIGLENLHRYTSDGRNHKVRLTVNFNSSGALGEMCVAHYNFVVASATQGYSYTLAPTLYRGTTVSVKGSPQGFGLDDVLLSQENARFSAVDNDQDDSALTNCAEKAQAGWWFGQCLPIVANPFGWSYLTMPGSVTDQHFHVSGLDMTRTSVRDSVRYVYMSLDYPIGV